MNGGFQGATDPGSYANAYNQTSTEPGAGEINANDPTDPKTGLPSSWTGKRIISVPAGTPGAIGRPGIGGTTDWLAQVD